MKNCKYACAGRLATIRMTVKYSLLPRKMESFCLQTRSSFDRSTIQATLFIKICGWFTNHLSTCPVTNNSCATKIFYFFCLIWKAAAMQPPPTHSLPRSLSCGLKMLKKWSTNWWPSLGKSADIDHWLNSIISICPTEQRSQVPVAVHVAVAGCEYDRWYHTAIYPQTQEGDKKRQGDKLIGRYLKNLEEWDHCFKTGRDGDDRSGGRNRKTASRFLTELPAWLKRPRWKSQHGGEGGASWKDMLAICSEPVSKAWTHCLHSFMPNVMHVMHIEEPISHPPPSMPTTTTSLPSPIMESFVCP